MYTKNKSQRITLRLSDEQFDFVRKTAEFIGVSPSDFLRMVITSAMSTEKLMAERNGNGRENDKANLDNLI